MRFLQVHSANLQVALTASRSADFARFPAGFCIQNIFIYRPLRCDLFLYSRREAALLRHNNAQKGAFFQIDVVLGTHVPSAPCSMSPVLLAKLKG
jgi:hypothetical protein